MTRFRFKGTNTDGTETTGEVEAKSESTARDILAGRGVEVLEIAAVAAGISIQKLTSTEQATVDGQVRELLSAGLPLPEGLRAAADEFDEPGFLRKLFLVDTLKGIFFQRSSARIQRALRRIASEVESGKSLEESLQTRSVPHEMNAVLQSGITSQSATIAVGEYANYAETAAKLRSHVMFLFAYPLVAICVAASMMGVFFCFLVPPVKHILDSFDTELPGLTQMVFGLSDTFVDLGPRIVIAGPILFVTSLIVFFSRGNRFARRIARAIPILGTSFRNLDLARTTHLLAVVLRHEAPIPGALRAAGTGSGNADITQACEELALTVESGHPLPSSEPTLAGLPLSFLQVAHNGSDRNTVADALHSMANIFEQRARVIMSLLAAVAQPIIVIAVGGWIAICFYALFMPIVKLLNDLA